MKFSIADNKVWDQVENVKYNARELLNKLFSILNTKNKRFYFKFTMELFDDIIMYPRAIQVRKMHGFEIKL